MALFCTGNRTDACEEAKKTSDYYDLGHQKNKNQGKTKSSLKAGVNQARGAKSRSTIYTTNEPVSLLLHEVVTTRMKSHEQLTGCSSC